MAFRKHPLLLQISALIVFFFAAILPLGYMLAQFVVALFHEPSKIVNVLVDSRQLVLLGRSLTVAISATSVAVLFGLPTAIILAAKDLPYRKLFYFLVLIPVLIPSYVMAGAWIHLFSPAGLLNRIVVGLFGPAAKLSVYSVAGCGWCLGISFFPVIAIIVAAGLSELDSSLIDIARLSTGRWGVFRYAVLPQIWPHLVASVCLVIIFVLGQYGVPSLLGVNTYPVEIFAQFSAFYDIAAAVATTVPLVVLVIFLIILQRQIMRNHDYVRITPSSEAGNPIHLDKFKHFATGFLVVLFIITTVLPFLSVLAYIRDFNKVWSTLQSFSGSLVTTSTLALLAAMVSTVIAFPIAHWLAHNQGCFTKTLDVLCWLPIAIPGTIIGLGLISLASQIPALQRNDSFGFLLLFAYIGMFTGFSIRVFQAACKRADPNIDEAAAIDCCKWWQKLFYIDIPIYLGAISVSVILVFVLVLGELNATVLLIPPGKATLSVSIDNLLHYGANATASALCLIEAGLVITAIVLGSLLLKAGSRLLR